MCGMLFESAQPHGRSEEPIASTPPCSAGIPTAGGLRAGACRYQRQNCSIATDKNHITDRATTRALLMPLLGKTVHSHPSAPQPGPSPPWHPGQGPASSPACPPPPLPPLPSTKTYKAESLVALQGEPIHQVAGFVGTIGQDVAEMSLGDQRH